MTSYYPQALEGFLLCLQYQQKPPCDAHSILLDVTKTELWSLPKIKEFFTQIELGNFKIDEETERFNEYQTLKGFIYCMVRQESLGEPADKSVLKAPGMELFPEAYVNTMYKRCLDGSYDMRKRKEVLPMFPVGFNQQMVKLLDTESRLTFGYTSKEHQRLVNETPIYLAKLSIFYADTFIHIRTSDGFNVKFSKQIKKKRTHCRFQNKKKVRYELGSYRRFARRNLLAILSWRNLEIGELRIQESRHFDYEENIVDILGKTGDIQLTFGRLRHPLKVRKFTFVQGDFSGIDAYFRKLDRNFIKSLEIKRYTKHPHQEWADDAIFRRRQWMRLERFESNYWFSGMLLVATYGHMNYAKFEVTHHLLAEQVREFKEVLLLNPNLIEIRIKIRISFDMLQAIVRPFEAVNIGVSEYLYFACFDYPNGDGDQLFVFLRDDLLWFVGPKYDRNQVTVVEDVVFVEDDEEYEVVVVPNPNDELDSDEEDDVDSKEGILGSVATC